MVQNTPNSSQLSMLDFVKTNETAWQTVTKTTNKKRKASDSPEGKEKEKPRPITTKNQFESLHVDENVASDTVTQDDVPTIRKKEPTPPPIFVQGVSNYTAMTGKVSQYIDNAKFTTKALANGVVKINVETVESYRKLVKEFRTKNVAFYTYQLKSERAFKVVIRHLHHSVKPEDIKLAIEEEGFQVRNVVNIRHWRTKDPLPLFFIDLEPDDKAREIYNVKYLLHTKIQIESPKPKHSIVQCMRCQQYGHSKTYCTLPPVCVRCGEEHDNRNCKKPRDDKPKCGLCGGEHTANYKGCPAYRKFSKAPTKSRNKAESGVVQHTANAVSLQRSFADVAANKRSDVPLPIKPQAQVEPPSSRLEVLIEKMISQNAVILELLTKLLTKLI